MTTFNLIALYAIVAGVTIALNVLFQRIVFRLYDGPNAIFYAMIGGALVALIVKYFLDRIFIFSVKSGPQASEFLRYAFTGGLITLVYFIVEHMIWNTFQTEFARDVGIVLGMTAGYGLKFLIDRDFVFRARQNASN